MRFKRLDILLLLVLVWSCSNHEKKPENQVTPVPENLFAVLQKEVPGVVESNLFLSVVNPNDCMMCYGPISRFFEEVKSKYNIENSNVIMLLPTMNQRQIDALFKQYIRMNQSTFSGIVADDKWYDFICEKVNGISTATSFALVINTNDEIVFAKEYKLMNDGLKK